MFHVYCGDGKGKTTAAVGLAVRYFGAGGRVYFYQFMKDGTSSEIDILRNIGIYTSACKPCVKFTFRMNDEEKNAVRNYHNRMLAEISEIKEKSLIVFDEIISAYNKNLLDRQLAERIILSHDDNIEKVITGRSPAEIFLDNADYVSEIQEIKHPYKKGISARKGIEY
ncbi:MAG: cob(I)yrinic acid a,c-diamide adenosyltransferase [Ruminococcus sp.]|nr:cob(I)yrinic acid a,c-diamide adenosyltransferase [Ruminococcus sp.]